MRGNTVMREKRNVADISWWTAVTAMAFLLSASTTNVLSQRGRDPGINQPGRVGNRPVGRDPGINQPGAIGNRGVGYDPGINQPGRAGNVGRDPGINQPGRIGNYGGSARQTRVRDPGFNQPGRIGNR